MASSRFLMTTTSPRSAEASVRKNDANPSTSSGQALKAQFSRNYTLPQVFAPHRQPTRYFFGFGLGFGFGFGLGSGVGLGVGVGVGVGLGSEVVPESALRRFVPSGLPQPLHASHPGPAL